MVLIESRETNRTCHACSADLGIAIYSKYEGKWKKKFVQKNVINFGQWGKLPKASVTKIGQNNYGLIFHNSSMSQGYYSEGYTLITNVEGKYKNVIDIAIHSNNKGYAEGTGNESYEWSAQVDFIEGGNKEFFDIIVLSIGTTEEWEKRKSNIIPINEISIYKFNGSEYELQKN